MEPKYLCWRWLDTPCSSAENMTVDAYRDKKANYRFFWSFIQFILPGFFWGIFLCTVFVFFFFGNKFNIWHLKKDSSKRRFRTWKPSLFGVCTSVFGFFSPKKMVKKGTWKIWVECFWTGPRIIQRQSFLWLCASFQIGGFRLITLLEFSPWISRCCFWGCKKFYNFTSFTLEKWSKHFVRIYFSGMGGVTQPTTLW